MVTSADPQASTRNAVAVHVVEDDAPSRESTARVLRAGGYTVRLYASAAEFLAVETDGAGCLVLDLSLPGPSGLDLQEQLAASDSVLSIVFVSGQADVPKTARAMKAGAVDFLPKPVDVPVLLDAVRQAIARSLERFEARRRRREWQLLYDRLTDREREVFAHVISGQLNKQIAFDLGTAEQTVKVHRGRVMTKLNADSVPDLIRIAAALGVSPVGQVRDPKVQ
jgi:FixJ family two-component response regulator